MKFAASRLLKTVYCLNMGALIIFFCFVVWQFWHSSLIDVLRISFNSVVLILLCYRFVRVISKPSSLDTVIANHVMKALRTLAVFLMWVGVIAMVSLLFIKPITLAIFSGSSEPRLGMLPILAYIGMAGILGVAGMFLFEVVRFVGRFSGESSVQP